MFRYVTKGKVTVLCGALILAAFGGVAHAVEMKIGYVDIQKAMNESEAGKEAKLVIESEYLKFQNEIAQRQGELQTLQDTLQRQGLMLSEKVRKEREIEYQNKLKEFKRWGEDRQVELKQKERELTKAALESLQTVVIKLGEEEKFTIILAMNEAGILYASKEIDLTDRVIQILNSANKK